MRGGWEQGAPGSFHGAPAPPALRSELPVQNRHERSQHAVHRPLHGGDDSEAHRLQAQGRPLRRASGPRCQGDRVGDGGCRVSAKDRILPTLNAPAPEPAGLEPGQLLKGESQPAVWAVVWTQGAGTCLSKPPCGVGRMVLVPPPWPRPPARHLEETGNQTSRGPAPQTHPGSALSPFRPPRRLRAWL